MDPFPVQGRPLKLKDVSLLINLRASISLGVVGLGEIAAVGIPDVYNVVLTELLFLLIEIIRKWCHRNNKLHDKASIL